MISLIRITHVNLVVTDVARARAFYGGLLGLVEIERAAGARRPGAWFRLGELELHLSEEPAAVAATGEQHVAFEVAGLDELRQRLAQAGAPIEPGRPLPGLRRLFTRDPAGNRLELQEAIVR